jgi:hypothetical protein
MSEIKGKIACYWWHDAGIVCFVDELVGSDLEIVEDELQLNQIAEVTDDGEILLREGLDAGSRKMYTTFEKAKNQLLLKLMKTRENVFSATEKIRALNQPSRRNNG